VPGCSTGEEVYWIAVSLVEYLEGSGRDEAKEVGFHCRGCA
jgi:chemotaxis methyl-accepting protein methylase